MSFDGCRVAITNCVVRWCCSITSERLLEVLADGFGVVQQDRLYSPDIGAYDAAPSGLSCRVSPSGFDL